MQNNIPEFKISLSHKVKPSERIIVKTSEEAAAVCRQVFDADTIEWVESFIVIALNKANKVIGFYKVSQGGVSGTIADPRVIMQFSLLSNASCLLLCHNHPSGSLKPSAQDQALTQKVKQAAMLFDTIILDHIILTDNGFFSMADEGIL